MLPPFAGRDRLWPRAKDCRSRTVRLRETRKTLCRRRSRAVMKSSRIASVGEEIRVETRRKGRARKARAERTPTYTALHHRLAHTFPTRLCTGVPLSQRNVFTDNNRRFSTSPTGDERDPPGRRHMKVYCHCAGGSDDTFLPFICLCGGARSRRDARPRVSWSVHIGKAQCYSAWSGGHGRGEKRDRTENDGTGR